MTQEQQDAAWRSLPEDFKKEVKEVYEVLECDSKYKDGYAQAILMHTLFGKHNLTATAEKPFLEIKDADAEFICRVGENPILSVKAPIESDKPKTMHIRTKHGTVAVPTKIEYGDSFWLAYRMELAKAITPKVISAVSENGISSDFCESVINKVATIVNGIVERLKEVKND